MSKNATPTRGRPGRPSSATTAANTQDRAVKELTRVFKSLADEHRIRILFLLAKNGEMHVSAIGEELGQSQPAVSHHLTQLRNAGLIEFRRDGKFNFYALNLEGVNELLGHLFPSGPTRVAIEGLEIHFKVK